MKVKAAMDQFKEGLKTLGLLSLLEEKPDLWKPLFVANTRPLAAGRSTLQYACVSVAYLHNYSEMLKNMFITEYSDVGSNHRTLEEQAWIHFMDFLDECEGKHSKERCC